MLSSQKLWPALRSVSVGDSVMGGSLLVRDDVPSRDESVNVAAVAARSIQAQSRASVHIQWPSAVSWAVLSEAPRASDLRLGRGDDVIDGEAELLGERLQRRR